jgi:hypothetical protein
MSAANAWVVRHEGVGERGSLCIDENKNINLKDYGMFRENGMKISFQKNLKDYHALYLCVPNFMREKICL